MFAARLCDLAQAGEALASPSVMDHLPRWGVVVTRRTFALRGVEKPVTASVITMTSPSDAASLDPICGVPLSAETAEATGAGLPGPGGSLLLTRMPRYVGAPSPAPTQHRQRERSHGLRQG